MKKIKELSLILSGVVLGLGLSISPQIYAATSSLLGSKVDKVIVVKLDKVELGKAIAVDGTSYLPVRSLANALDVGVNYTPNEINLTSSNEGATTMETTPNVIEPETLDVNELSKKILTLKKNIQNAKDVLSNKDSSERGIVSYEETIQMINRMRDAGVSGYSDNDVKNIQAKIDNTKKILSDAETNLPIWQAELADLESQLAALK